MKDMKEMLDRAYQDTLQAVTDARAGSEEAKWELQKLAELHKQRMSMKQSEDEAYVRHQELRIKEAETRDGKKDRIIKHEDLYAQYDVSQYREILRNRWDVWKNEPIENAGGLCYALRKCVNLDESRQRLVLELAEKHPKIILFYSFDYELEVLKDLGWSPETKLAEWNGHKHEPIPAGERWVYLVNYSAGAEGWNCTQTDTILFYSQHYSYKVMVQASGRIDRLNTPYHDLYYYHLKSRSGIDIAIGRALQEKKTFNENRFVKW